MTTCGDIPILSALQMNERRPVWERCTLVNFHLLACYRLVAVTSTTLKKLPLTFNKLAAFFYYGWRPMKGGFTEQIGVFVEKNCWIT